MNEKNDKTPPPEPATLKSVIQEFLRERLKPKLEEVLKTENKLSEEDFEKREESDLKRQQLLKAYVIENWVADAARRVSQIQQVTHALKFSHPDARGSSLYSQGIPAAGELTVGSQSINEKLFADVVGNAAALDVNKFLSLQVDGETVLSRAIRGDVELQQVFSDNVEEAKEWMVSFAGILESKDEPASHKLAKQLYWPLDNGRYHILSPLFPSSLVHVVWEKIREDRFSEKAKEARKARNNGVSHPHGYREYPDVAVQQFGGTKPQNISQLNSVRHGENYLLPSCPPNWQSSTVFPPFGRTIFGPLLMNHGPVKSLLNTLHKFLVSVKDVNSKINIRDKRKELVAYVCDALLHYAAQLQSLPGGWTLDKNCRLNRDEKYWLDPGRSELDEEFAVARAQGDWQKGICKSFANWFNARLSGKRNSLPMGDDEAREWSKVLGKELQIMEKELDIND